jgi:hypothetical protein
VKRCKSKRSPGEASVARTPWQLRRLRDVVASVRRSAQRKGVAAIDTVPAIEDQLHTLRPICSAQRVSTGTACGAPAVAVAEIHAIDGCEQMGLSPDGDVVETLCRGCLSIMRRAMATYVGDKCEMAFRRGTQPMCNTCGRATECLPNVFAVHPVWPK